ncbi:hypothetical protein RS130_20485 [Paraglaciecola aquimarina]|uniref:Cytochrome c-552/4 domain-containing protein n=1 Tax=Paraglaciecola aquimarina TaxID=1235557 RepID=A0ABU3T122_9ALTE|nr:hypothetical protein [Paraglaciecola aquimarina]MDU0355950.1 hypothetical protein [Paraglaciecola aquimarina]
MCADCHSDGLKRKYTPETNHFDTSWDNINVGCLSCHGEMKDHGSPKTNKNTLNLTAKEQQVMGQWLLTLKVKK